MIIDQNRLPLLFYQTLFIYHRAFLLPINSSQGLPNCFQLILFYPVAVQYKSNSKSTTGLNHCQILTACWIISEFLYENLPKKSMSNDNRMISRGLQQMNLENIQDGEIRLHESNGNWKPKRHQITENSVQTKFPTSAQKLRQIQFRRAVKGVPVDPAFLVYGIGRKWRSLTRISIDSQKAPLVWNNSTSILNSSSTFS